MAANNPQQWLKSTIQGTNGPAYPLYRLGSANVVGENGKLYAFGGNTRADRLHNDLILIDLGTKLYVLTDETERSTWRVVNCGDIRPCPRARPAVAQSHEAVYGTYPTCLVAEVWFSEGREEDFPTEG